jgi:uncharacterized membrane protein
MVASHRPLASHRPAGRVAPVTRALASFFVALVFLVILDGVWFSLVGHDFYQARISALLRDDPAWNAVILFYLVHAVGIAVFAVPAAMRTGTWLAAAGCGALYGICVYAALDLTNLATLRGWPATVTVVDLVRGAVTTAFATVTALGLVER